LVREKEERKKKEEEKKKKKYINIKKFNKKYYNLSTLMPIAPCGMAGVHVSDFQLKLTRMSQLVKCKEV